MPTSDEEILHLGKITLGRALNGRNVRSVMLVGSSQTTKSKLLSEICELAHHQGFATSSIPIAHNHSFTSLLFQAIEQVLRSIPATQDAQQSIKTARKALQSFALRYDVCVEGLELNEEPELGLADSGNLSLDLSDLFLLLGKALQGQNTGWAILIDDLHVLPKSELAALIVAFHRVAQDRVPILLFGSGLPSLRAICGEAKPYSERLFLFLEV